MPLRARLLWLLMVPSLGSLGIVLASWPIPLITALHHDGVGGLENIPVEWYGWARPPAWLKQEGEGQYNFVDLCSLLLTIPFALGFAVLATRIWKELGIDVLHWMTNEDVERFNKEKQWF